MQEYYHPLLRLCLNKVKLVQELMLVEIWSFMFYKLQSKNKLNFFIKDQNLVSDDEYMGVLACKHRINEPLTLSYRYLL